jgi:nucleotide-binding universal stress UspA family protein
MFKKLLVAYDGSRGSIKALESALEIASKFSSEVHLLSVVDDLPKLPDSAYEVDSALIKATNRLEQKHTLAYMIAKKRGMEIKCIIQVGDRIDKIIKYANEENFDTILVGHKVQSGFFRTLKSPTAIRVASRSARTTILIHSS